MLLVDPYLQGSKLKAEKPKDTIQSLRRYARKVNKEYEQLSIKNKQLIEQLKEALRDAEDR